MSLLYHNDTITKKEKELLRALLIQFCKLEFSQFSKLEVIRISTSLLPAPLGRLHKARTES